MNRQRRSPGVNGFFKDLPLSKMGLHVCKKFEGTKKQIPDGSRRDRFVEDLLL